MNSFVGLDDFFVGFIFRKKLFTLKSDCGLIFQFQSISFVKRKANFTIGRQSVKVTKNVILVSKVEFIFLIFQRNKSFTY